jgi:hypothetical protein
MNIDDLKDVWKRDEPSGIHLPISTQKLGKTSSAVAAIRKNMKAEFIATLIVYPVMFGLLFIYQRNAFFFNATSILLFSILMLNIYYASRFFAFYQSIGRYDLSMRNSIYKVAYELELNTELYKVFNFCITPLFILVSFGIVCNKKTSDYIQHILTADVFFSSGKFLVIFFAILIILILIYAWISGYIRRLYGKHLMELKQVIDDLEKED